MTGLQYKYKAQEALQHNEKPISWALKVRVQLRNMIRA